MATPFHPFTSIEMLSGRGRRIGEDYIHALHPAEELVPPLEPVRDVDPARFCGETASAVRFLR